MGCAKQFRDSVPARYVLCIMLFFGFMTTFLLRVNINLAVVAMVNSTTMDVSSGMELNVTGCASDISLSVDNGTVQQSKTPEPSGEFEWNQLQQTIILSSFFWGYLLFQIPGGRVAEMYGTKRVFGSAVVVSGVLSLVLPLAARTHWTLLLVVRALQGLAQGVQYPALSAAVGQWVPVSERARFVSFAVQGASLGTVISLPLCGVIITSCGWETVFLVSGAVSIVWGAAWWYLVFDSPENHPRISREELLYLRGELRDPTDMQKPSAVPWKQVFTSRQFIVACIAAFGNDWGFHTYVTLGPKFMKESLGFDLEKSSWLTSLPFLAQYMFANVYGMFADMLLKQGVSLLRVRKISNFMSHILPACGLLAMSFTECNVTLTLTILTISFSLIGAFTSGHFQAPLDIAPNFAGSLTGLMNAIGSTTGIVSPPVAGAILLSTSDSTAGWRVIFIIAAAVYVATSLPYLLFAKATLEPWNGRLDESTKSKRTPTIILVSVGEAGEAPEQAKTV